MAATLNGKTGTFSYAHISKQKDGSQHSNTLLALAQLVLISKSIPKFITDIFTKRENVVKKERLDYYVAGDIELMEEKSTKKPLKPKEKDSDSEFGKTPQPNVLEMFQGLPSIATMERRIQRMDDLLLGIPYQKPLVQRLLEFSESTSKSSISEKRIINNEQIKTKSPTSPSKKASLFSKFFSTKVIPS